METVQALSTLRFTDDLLAHLRAISPRLHLSQQTCHDADVESHKVIPGNVSRNRTGQVVG
jgi:hypothetical protein